MNKRIKKMWIKALRSGEYKQGKGYLRQDGEYCCLGVLCDLHRKLKKKKRWKADSSGTFFMYDGDCSLLPTSVINWAGLEDDDPKLSKNKHAAALNDEGRSFNYIADRIEKYL